MQAGLTHSHPPPALSYLPVLTLQTRTTVLSPVFLFDLYSEKVGEESVVWQVRAYPSGRDLGLTEPVLLASVVLYPECFWVPKKCYGTPFTLNATVWKKKKNEGEHRTSSSFNALPGMVVHTPFILALSTHTAWSRWILEFVASPTYIVSSSETLSEKWTKIFLGLWVAGRSIA